MTDPRLVAALAETLHDDETCTDRPPYYSCRQRAKAILAVLAADPRVEEWLAERDAAVLARARARYRRLRGYPPEVPGVLRLHTDDVLAILWRDE